MGVTADKVIVILEARLDRYNRDVSRADKGFTGSMDRMRSSSRALERQIGRDSGAIGGHLRALAGTIAAAFSAREVANLADTWTRYTNRLMTAGIEGEDLARVQQRLLDIANQNGVEVEELGRLYGRLAISADQLGASQGHLEAVTRAVAAAIRVQGSTSEEARGGLLQLSQAIASPRVEMEEFGSVLDALPALVTELAKRIPEAGGSVAKLRSLIKDRKGAGISGGTLFTAILESMDALEEKAQKATLTIGNSFTVLFNELAHYVGAADDGLSATEKISGAIISLADNLDRVVPVIATLAALILGRYLGGMVASTVATVRATLAVNVYSAALARLAVAQGLGGAQGFRMAAAMTAQTGAMALATRAALGLRVGMLAAFGGPVGLAVTALTVGITLYMLAANDAEEQTLDMALAQRQASAAEQQHQQVLIDLTTKMGEGAAAARDAARAARDKALADIAAARAALQHAIAEREKARALAKTERAEASAAAIGGGEGGAIVAASLRTQAEGRTQQANRNIIEAAADLQTLARRLTELNGAMQGVSLPRMSPGAGTGTGASAAGRSGPTPEEIAARFEQEMDRYVADVISATADLAGTRRARHIADLQLIELERQSRNAEIAADEDYSQAQKDALVAANDRAAALTRQALVADFNAELEQGLYEQRQAGLDTMLDLLDAEREMARTAEARRDIELRILAIQKEQEKLRLEAIIADREATEAAKAIAQARLEELDRIYGERAAVVRDQNKGPLGGYADSMNKSPEELRENAEQLIVDEIEEIRGGMRDAIAKAIGTDDPLITGLIDMLIEQLVIRPLANALAQAGQAGGAGGGVGSFFAGLVSSIFGGARAAGGPGQAGKMYRVNEARGQTEYWKPAGNGQVIPLGKMNARAHSARPVVNAPMYVDARGAVMADTFARLILAKSKTYTDQRSSQAGAAAVKAAPGQVAKVQRYGGGG